jgi:FdhD protein
LTPVVLSVNGEVWLTFSCSTEKLESLAVGFLFNEGIIGSLKEVASVRLCENQTNLDVWLNHAAEKPEQWLRSSGCTGGVTRPAAPNWIVPLEGRHRFTPQALLNGMDQLYKVEGLYQESRGLHCSALYDGQAICSHAADIGRHNTLDKLAGQILLDGLDLPVRIVLTTGRISSEMLQKCARLGAEVVISRTAPTNLAVDLAEDLGVTVVGYARRDTFIVYTHSERIEQ